MFLVPGFWFLGYPESLVLNLSYRLRLLSCQSACACADQHDPLAGSLLGLLLGWSACVNFQEIPSSHSNLVPPEGGGCQCVGS